MIKLTEQVTIAVPGEDVDAPIVVRLVPDDGKAYVPWHPATIAMLREMESVDFDGKAVYDFGAGSGILGLVAKAMGAKLVIAIEYIPEIAECARANIAANNVKIDVEIEGPHFTADIILANVGDAEVLRELRSRCELLIGTAETKRRLLSGGQGTKPTYTATAHDVGTLLTRDGRAAKVDEFDDGWAIVRG